MNKYCILTLILFFSVLSVFAMDIDPKDVNITLEEAFPIAIQYVKSNFPDIKQYIFYSATPRVLKGDSEGIHWQFLWQEKAFPHNKWITVRVYIKDGSLEAEKWENGTYQKEHQEYLK